MTEAATGTNGGRGGTNGARRRLALMLAAGFAVILVLVMVANAESTISDLRAAGIHEAPRHVWIWEATSLFAWATLFPAIWWLVRRLWPPRFGWPLALLLLGLASVPASAWHIALMVALRKAAYALEGGHYAFFGGIADRLLYEYRKDAATYAQFAALAAIAQWLLARAAVVTPTRLAPIIEVNDGTVTHRVPVDEIEHVAAAGNYVELAWGANNLRSLLHRATLAALANELGDNFVRIHRSRLVRRAAIRRVETDRSGDFTVELASGTQLRGSRRYRAGIEGDGELRA